MQPPDVLDSARGAPARRPIAAGRADDGRRPVRNRLYRDGSLVREDVPAEEIPQHLASPGSVMWLDLYRPGQAELRMLDAALGLHELAIESAMGERQRPRLVRYDGHLSMIAYATTVDARSGRLRTSQLAAFITTSVLVTVRNDDDFDVSDVLARWDAAPHLVRHGVGFLLYGLLDHLVDEHFRAVQAMDDRIDRLEDVLFEEERNAIHAVQRHSFQLRKDLVLLRRVVLPMRELIGQVMRSDLGEASQPLVPYFQDVYDNVLRVGEWTESLRDMVSTIAETNLTVQGNRINAIMKKVTSWAAIIAVPTAITGFYGQNLPYPGAGQFSGVITSTALIAALSLALYIAFKRRDWL
jgi:magnesium transporter